MSEIYDYLSLEGDQVRITCSDDLKILDFHIHLNLALPGGKKSKGQPTFPTLPSIEDTDFSLPYWTKRSALNDRYTGVFAPFNFISEGLKIYKDMIRGGSVENALEAMDLNQIERALVLPISTAKKDVSCQALAYQEAYPDRFMAFCSVHPNDSSVLKKLKDYHEREARGLKLKITNREIDKYFDKLVDMLTLCSRLGLIVLFHTGSVSNLIDKKLSPFMDRVLQSTAIVKLDKLLDKCPKDLHFVFGHAGISEYKKVADLMKKYPETYAELSCQSSASIHYLINEVGADRLLYGSDWPALPQAYTLSQVLLATENQPLARKNILYNNGHRLLKGGFDELL